MASYPSSEGFQNVRDKNSDKSVVSDLQMQESAEFSENTVAGRKESQRLQPWFRALPVQNIIPTMYRALYSSPHLQPFQLLSLAKTVLKFITQQISLNNKGKKLLKFRESNRNHTVFFID